MTIKAAPSFAEFPLYNADVQDSSGFLAVPTTRAKRSTPVRSSRTNVELGEVREGGGVQVPAAELGSLGLFRLAMRPTRASRTADLNVRFVP
jgi:hypothetical protein